MNGLGRFFGVGVGPGDPELLTLKALRVLQESPVICMPKKGEHSRSYALSIVSSYLDPARQELLELVFPMKRDLDLLPTYWRAATDEIIVRLRAGRDVAFITEGDPLLFGTFIYVYDLLRQAEPSVAIEIVPGVSSVNASAASALLPLATTSDRLAIVPASYALEELSDILQRFDTVVLLKVNDVFDRVLDILESLSLTDRAVYVRRCTSPQEEIVRDVRTLRGQKLDYLSQVIVRK
ncbi:MAG: precorrin-2 C(20)-methyltransferase [Chloroflexota bacterium]|nr:MAG: precorrin-2 C(20)-methyltransferase [Chloroflexota bacterium]